MALQGLESLVVTPLLDTVPCLFWTVARSTSQ
jgi:hypothetical protein